MLHWLLLIGWQGDVWRGRSPVSRLDVIAAVPSAGQIDGGKWIGGLVEKRAGGKQGEERAEGWQLCCCCLWSDGGDCQDVGEAACRCTACAGSGGRAALEAL